MNVAPTNFAVVVLAGGEGRRIGGDKPLRELGGRRLIDRALERARQWSVKVVVSIRDVRPEGLAAAMVEDDPSVGGPVAGLIAGLRFARSEGCPFLLAIAADMPFLPVDLPERLSAAMPPDVNAALASSGGELQPIASLWRVDALRQVDDYVVSGRRSLKGLAATIGFAEVKWPASTPDPFFSINTPEQLALAEQWISKNSGT
ncbi:MAG: molybdenum cofactor guanylyltransferase [Sphingomicrobium sp.]